MLKIKRAFTLSVPLDTARQRLASAFSLPTLVLDKGNLFTSRVECWGSIEGDKIIAQCTVFGKSTSTYDMEGYIASHLNGVRIHMTVRSSFPALIYLPVILIAVLWVAIPRTGAAHFSVFWTLLAFLFLGGFLYVGLIVNLSYAGSQFEELIRRCVTEPDSFRR